MPAKTSSSRSSSKHPDGTGTTVLSTSQRVRRSRSGQRAAPVPSSAQEPQEIEDPRHVGVFVYINGLLCRTADITGRFCPSDVFGGVDHAPARTSLPVPTLKKNKSHHTFSCNAADMETEAKGFDSDCPIFDTFGVITGGVLINPFEKTFADYTQTAPYTITGVKPSARSAVKETDEYLSEVKEVQTTNELMFRRGTFMHIRPTAALTFCTSELPLPTPAPELTSTMEKTVSSPQDPAAALCPPLRRRRCRASASTVEEWHSKLVIPRGLTMAEAATHKTVWRDAEAFRQLLTHNNVLRAVEPLHVLPPSIPFFYRERGVPVQMKDVNDDDETCYHRVHETSVADPSVDGNCADVPSRGVRSAVASFTCFSGLPQFASDRSNPARETAREQRSPHLSARLRKRLRPYNAIEVTKGQTQLKQMKYAATDATSLASADIAEHHPSTNSEEVEQDLREYFLTPYSSDRPRRAAFMLFLVYFNHLGLVCNGVRLTGETEAASAPQQPRTGRCAWGLCPDAEYSVEAEVRRKRQLTRTLWSNAAETFPGGSRWSTTSGNYKLVAEAFTVLMTSKRNALLKRIHTLNVYLRTLSKDAPVPL